MYIDETVVFKTRFTVLPAVVKSELCLNLCVNNHCNYFTADGLTNISAATLASTLLSCMFFLFGLTAYIVLISELSEALAFLISRPPKAIAAYVFAQYFIFIFYLFLVLARKVAVTVVHIGELVLGREVTQASVGGRRANNIR